MVSREGVEPPKILRPLGLQPSVACRQPTTCSKVFMVRETGVEPARPKTSDPKSGASASSATLALSVLTPTFGVGVPEPIVCGASGRARTGMYEGPGHYPRPTVPLDLALPY